MATEESEFTETSGDLIAEALELRRRARWRAFVLQGAGFALLGNSLGAWLSVGCVIFIPLLVWFGFQPNLWSLSALLLASIYSIVLWKWELNWIKRAPLRTKPVMGLLNDRFVLCTLIAHVSMGAVFLLTLSRFYVHLEQGNSMAPTVTADDLVIYHRAVDPERLQAGTVVYFEGNSDAMKWFQGKKLLARILAVPGDQISIDKGMLCVNSVPQPYESGPASKWYVVEVPESPATITVPPDCYFCVTDDVRSGFDSRLFSWVRHDDILSTRLWSIEHWLQPIK